MRWKVGVRRAITGKADVSTVRGRTILCISQGLVCLEVDRTVFGNSPSPGPFLTLDHSKSWVFPALWRGELE